MSGMPRVRAVIANVVIERFTIKRLQHEYVAIEECNFYYVWKMCLGVASLRR